MCAVYFLKFLVGQIALVVYLKFITNTFNLNFKGFPLSKYGYILLCMVIILLCSVNITIGNI